MKPIIVFIITCSLCPGLHAQLGKRVLNRAKTSAEHKVNSKVDQAIDKTVDKGVKEVDTLLTGKKRKEETNPAPEAKSKQNNKPAANTGNNTPAAAADTSFRPPEPSHQFAQRMNAEHSSLIIFTNCTCNAGKIAMEKALKNMSGIVAIQVDAKNGDASLTYNIQQVQYSAIIKEINKLGFEADGSPPAPGKKGCN